MDILTHYELSIVISVARRTYPSVGCCMYEEGFGNRGGKHSTNILESSKSGLYSPLYISALNQQDARGEFLAGDRTSSWRAAAHVRTVVEVDDPGSQTMASKGSKRSAVKYNNFRISLHVPRQLLSCFPMSSSQFFALAIAPKSWRKPRTVDKTSLLTIYHNWHPCPGSTDFLVLISVFQYKRTYIRLSIMAAGPCRISSIGYGRL